MVDPNVYIEWLRRYSSRLDLSEGLRGVEAHYSQLSRSVSPTTDQRLAALEQMNPLWAGFITSLVTERDQRFYDNPEDTIERMIEAVQFLRLAILVNNMELDQIATDGKDI